MHRGGVERPGPKRAGPAGAGIPSAVEAVRRARRRSVGTIPCFFAQEFGVCGGIGLDTQNGEVFPLERVWSKKQKTERHFCVLYFVQPPKNLPWTLLKYVWSYTSVFVIMLVQAYGHSKKVKGAMLVRVRGRGPSPSAPGIGVRVDVAKFATFSAT